MFRGKKRAYTRKEYIGGVPASRITQFDVGDKIADFSVEVTLSAKEECLVRHNALESARVTANRYIQTHDIAINEQSMNTHKTHSVV